MPSCASVWTSPPRWRSRTHSLMALAEALSQAVVLSGEVVGGVPGAPAAPAPRQVPVAPPGAAPAAIPALQLAV